MLSMACALLLQQLAHLRVRDELEHRGIEQTNRLHRLAQIVTGGGQEPALGSIGALRFLAGCDQLFVDLLPFGGVANGGGYEQLVADAERRQPDTGRELAAVGAQSEQIGDARAHLAIARACA